MNNLMELPAGYVEIEKIDLQKDKKTALLVNVFALFIAVPMLIAGAVFVPLTALFDFSADPWTYVSKWIFLLVGIILYMVLHELVHGVCMKHFSGAKVRYGLTGLYAYAGSEAYFNKKSYIIIALAPVVVWGFVLLLLNFLVGTSWFWCVYFIQICNISGAAGDVYVTYKFSKMPEDILIQDIGVSMTVYSTPAIE